MLGELTGRAGAAERGGARGRRRRVAAAAGAAAAVLAVACYALAEARAMAPQSDGDSMVLQAHAMLGGNVLLRGWRLSDVSFYTTELPEYMLVVAFLGVRPAVVQVCAALTWTLLVAGAAAVARGRSRGRAGITAALVAAGIMAGPSLDAAAVLLNDPDHTGTAVPVLAALALAGWGGPRWWVAPAVFGVLACGVLGDPLTLVTGVAPVVAVCGLRARRSRHDLLLAAAAVAAVAAAKLAERAIAAAGGWTAARVAVRAGQAGAWPATRNFLGLYSAVPSGHWYDGGPGIAAIHMTCAAAVIAAVAAGLWRLPRVARPHGAAGGGGGDPVTAMLALAVTFNVAAYALAYHVTASNSREIAPAFTLGAALAGRVLGPAAARRDAPLLLAWGAAIAVAMVPPLACERPPRPAYSGLAAWVRAHHLRGGLAGYWQAASVAVGDGGTVTMVPVAPGGPSGRLAARAWESDLTLASPRSGYADFVVTGPPPDGISAAAAIAAFGKPDAAYPVGALTVLTWHRNLLPALAGIVSPG